MWKVQTDKNFKNLHEILALNHNEKQPHEDQELSITQDWNLNNKSSSWVLKYNKNIVRCIVEKTDRSQEVRRRAQVITWQIWKYVLKE